MASPLRLTVHPAAARSRLSSGAPEAAAEAAWQAVVDEFEAVDASMSRFRVASELTARNAGPGRVTWRLRRALAVADRAWRQTGGRFDARVARALEAIGFQGAEGRLVPLPAQHPSREPAVGRTFELTIDHGVALPEPVDLGGLGKGLALRWAADRAVGCLAAILADGGGFLLEAGGDLVVRGVPSGGRWQVAIEDPAGDPTPVAVVGVDDGEAVATSSIRINAWRTVDGRSVHHLLDPRTGEPAGATLAAVTVVTRDPAWAEVWSKALFVEGSAGIGPLARSRGLAAWWVTSEGSLEMTPAARPRTAWLASDA